jgi:3-dehydroquinate dehydratase II
MKILVINGPNLNLLGNRNPLIYGNKTLEQIYSILHKQAEKASIDITFYQSNSEGALIDFIQSNSTQADGIIINPGALTHYGLSLRDALADCGLPVIEVHLSNIYSREEWRSRSIIAPIVKGQVSGLGWQGYCTALQAMINALKGTDWE